MPEQEPTTFTLVITADGYVEAGTGELPNPTIEQEQSE